MLVIERERGLTAANVMEDDRITLKAKGVFGYLVTREEGEHITLDRMLDTTKESAAAVRAAIKELEQSEYLVRVRDNSGGFAKYDWILKL